jgi:hypothetical protein
LLADLRGLRVEAASLPELAPTRDLWAGIAARIETPVVDLRGGTVEGWTAGTHRRTQLWMGLAAAGLVAITATVTRELTKRAVTASVSSVSTAASAASAASTVASNQTAQAAPRETAPSSGQGAGAPVSASSVGSVPAPTRHVAAAASDTAPLLRRSAVPAQSRLVVAHLTAEQTYDAEIAQLRAVLAYRRPQLDSTTVAVVEKNLKIIDDAIVQCRQALRKDPASRFLLESLNDALDTKVQLLRTAVALPSRS